MKYFQCELQNGNIHAMTWIPGSLAKSGEELMVKIDGEWVEGWFVRYAYLIFHKTKEEVGVGSREYRSHRKRTDI